MDRLIEAAKTDTSPVKTHLSFNDVGIRIYMSISGWSGNPLTSARLISWMSIKVGDDNLITGIMEDQKAEIMRMRDA